MAGGSANEAAPRPNHPPGSAALEATALIFQGINIPHPPLPKSTPSVIVLSDCQNPQYQNARSKINIQAKGRLNSFDPFFYRISHGGRSSHRGPHRLRDVSQ